MSWFSIQELEYLLRIVLAAVCGGAIGFERERRSKSAGIRTHIIVALSAALMMVVSKYGFFDVIGLGGISLDASRVAAGVVTAIGFLGVGSSLPTGGRSAASPPPQACGPLLGWASPWGLGYTSPAAWPRC